MKRAHLHRAVLPARLQPQDPQRLRHNHALLPIVWGRNALEELQTLEGGGATGSLVRDHAADGSEKDFGRSAVMEGARLFGVYNVALVKEVVVAQLNEGGSLRIEFASLNGLTRYLVAEEATRNVDLLAANDNNLLAVQDLLGDDRGQPAQKMALTINDDGAGGDSGHGESVRANS